MNIRKTPALMLMLSVASLSGSAFGQEAPGVSALSKHLAVALPSYWQVDDFAIIAQSREGDVRNPAVIFRYEALVRNSAELLKETGQRVGPFSVAVPTVEQGQSRTLFGIMELGYKGGAWSGVVEIENPVNALGQPADFFVDPVVVLGSDRYQQVTGLLATSQVTELVNALENQIAEARLDQEKQLADLEIAHSANLMQIEQNQTRELQALRSGSAPELEQLRNQANAAIENLQQEYQNKLAGMQKLHAENLAQIGAEQAGEIRELEVGFTTRIESLKNQISQSGELADLQQRFMRILEEQAVGYQRIAELHANALQEKTNIMQSYLGQWTGSLSCSNKQWQVRFLAELVEGQSVTGTIVFTSSETETYSASMNILNVDMSFPVPVTLIPTGTEDLFTYEGEIGQDGVLRGTATRNSNCSLVISQ